MNRKSFLIMVGISLTALPVFGGKKKKGKGRGKQNNKNTRENAVTVDVSLSGIISLKPKDHSGEADDYYFHSKGKQYIMSRTLYEKISSSTGQNVTLYCRVMGGKKIIAINHIKK